jgi:hypothetical protein
MNAIYAPVVAVAAVHLAACGGRIATDAFGTHDSDGRAEAGLMVPSDGSSVVALVDAGSRDGTQDDATSPVRVDAAPIDSPTDDGPQVADDASAAADVSTDGVDASGLMCSTGQPVPQCVEYFAIVAWCDNEPSVASEGPCQTAAIPHTMAELMSISQLCEVNLERIEGACCEGCAPGACGPCP